MLDRLQSHQALVVGPDQLRERVPDVGPIELGALLIHQCLHVGEVLPAIEHELQHDQILRSEDPHGTTEEWNLAATIGESRVKGNRGHEYVDPHAVDLTAELSLTARLFREGLARMFGHEARSPQRLEHSVEVVLGGTKMFTSTSTVARGGA